MEEAVWCGRAPGRCLSYRGGPFAGFFGVSSGGHLEWDFVAFLARWVHLGAGLGNVLEPLPGQHESGRVHPDLGPCPSNPAPRGGRLRGGASTPTGSTSAGKEASEGKEALASHCGTAEMVLLIFRLYSQ